MGYPRKLIYTAAAAAKLLQSCLTLCDPIDGRPPGSPIPGILQARTLEWVAIAFSTSRPCFQINMIFNLFWQVREIRPRGQVICPRSHTDTVWRLQGQGLSPSPLHPESGPVSITFSAVGLFCAGQYGSCWSPVASEHLKCGSTKEPNVSFFNF